jgi:gluconokinase
MKRVVRPPRHLVVMGVSGAGKSVIGERLAKALRLPLIEGDEFHPARNIEKMRQGLPLDDSDRAGWLDRLGKELARHPHGAVLACSALKRAYRDKLRHHVPGLRFVHLDLTQEQAQQRVASRRGGHFYPTSLVASQFEALEDPSGEDGVLVIDGMLAPDEVTRRAAEWVRASGADSTMRN